MPAADRGRFDFEHEELDRIILELSSAGNDAAVYIQAFDGIMAALHMHIRGRRLPQDAPVSPALRPTLGSSPSDAFAGHV